MFLRSGALHHSGVLPIRLLETSRHAPNIRRRNNLGIDSAFITVVPIFFVRYGIFSLEMGLKRG